MKWTIVCLYDSSYRVYLSFLNLGPSELYGNAITINCYSFLRLVVSFFWIWAIYSLEFKCNCCFDQISWLVRSGNGRISRIFFNILKHRELFYVWREKCLPASVWASSTSSSSSPSTSFSYLFASHYLEENRNKQRRVNIKIRSNPQKRW